MLIILLFLTLFAFDSEPLIAIVLVGLVVFIWKLLSKIDELKEIVDKQVQSFSSVKERIAKLESTNEKPVTEKTQPTENIFTEKEVPKTSSGEGTKSAALSRSDTITKQTTVKQTPPLAASEKAEIKTPTPPPPAKPIVPAAPSFIERAIKAVWNWFVDGNTFVRVGVVILFMGMTFLISYAIEENLLPIELRLAAVGAVAIALIYWGWRQREKRQGFSLVVQGGGIGLLYLTIFAGFSLYHVIPSGFAFVLLALIVMLAAALAIYQDAKPLALFATVGGFLAPILTSSGSNNYIGLFSYYTVLNLGIFSIAWFKSWRILNFLGFLFTFAISTVWGVLNYKPEYFSTTEPFLIIFFLMYVAIGVLFARNRIDFYKDYVDSSVIFGTPLLAFGLQCAMVKDYEYGVAISAFSLAAFYFLLTNVLWNKYGDRLRLLSESFLSLGAIFATLAVPFAIDGTLTGATWAIEGAGILWISIQQQQKYRRLFAIVLIFAAGVILASELSLSLSDPSLAFEYAFANSVFIGCIIIAVAASCSSWLLSREFEGKLELEKPLSIALLLYGLFVLFAGFEYQIKDFSLYRVHGVLLASLSGVCALCFTVAGTRLKWLNARWVSVSTIAPLAVAAALCYSYQPQLSDNYGYLVWVVSLLIYLYGLKQSLSIVPAKPLLMAHVGLAIIIISLLFWDGIWQLLLCYSLLAIAFNYFGSRWGWSQLRTLALGFLPVLILCGIAAIRVDGNLIDLSSIASDVSWSFPPGYALWPFGFVVYFYLMRQNPKIGDFSTSNMHYAGAALIYGLLLWLGPWPLLLGVSLLSILCCALWIKYTWREMYFTSMALLPIMLLLTLLNLLGNVGHPFFLQDYNLNLQINAELGYVLWPLALAGLFWSFKQYDKRSQPAWSIFQNLAILLPVLLISWEASWHILDHVVFKNGWHIAWLPLVTMLTITMILKLNVWPFTQHRKSYFQLALPVLGVVILAWSLLQLISSANSMPLPWLPLVNPIDIVQAVIVIGTVMWSKEIALMFNNSVERKQIIYAVLAFIFLWINVDLLRSVHHFANIPWRMPDILTADISQTALSLLWGLSGLFTTLYSSRAKRRTLWICGAVILAVVVVKLFAIDLAAQDTVERIISFTGVGLLLMLVGYFSPLPPKKNITTAEEGA